MDVTHAVYQDLTLEFYTTLRLSDQAHKKFECRLNGKPIKIDYDTMLHVFRFPKGGIYESPNKYKSRDFYMDISSKKEIWDVCGSPNWLIRNHNYVILHKFIVIPFSGRWKATKCRDKS